MEQLKLAVTSVDIEMSDELLGEIEAVQCARQMSAPDFILGMKDNAKTGQSRPCAAMSTLAAGKNART